MQEPSNPYEALMLKAAQDEAFREALLQDPKGTIEAELRGPLPENLTINVVENKPNELILVIPPKFGDELTDDALESVAGGVNGDHVVYSIATLGFGCAASAVIATISDCRAALKNPKIPHRRI